MNRFRQALQRAAGTAKRATASWSADVLLTAGASCTAYGAWLLHPAAGYITGGVLLIAGGVLAARGVK